MFISLCSKYGQQPVIEPDSLLLEDRRSQISSEEHNQTMTFAIVFRLSFWGSNLAVRDNFIIVVNKLKISFLCLLHL